MEHTSATEDDHTQRMRAIERKREGREHKHNSNETYGKTEKTTEKKKADEKRRQQTQTDLQTEIRGWLPRQCMEYK